MYKEMNLEFDTADAHDPVLEFKNGELIASFLSWNQKLRRMIFKDTRMFSWEPIEESFHLPPDRIYEVVSSPWLSMNEFISENYKQFKLCFNASYYCLNVVAKSIEEG